MSKKRIAELEKERARLRQVMADTARLLESDRDLPGWTKGDAADKLRAALRRTDQRIVRKDRTNAQHLTA
jgi:hypothetical protein